MNEWLDICPNPIMTSVIDLPSSSFKPQFESQFRAKTGSRRSSHAMIPTVYICSVLHRPLRLGAT